MKTKLLSVVLLLAFLSLFNQTYAQDFYPLNDGDFWEYVQADTFTTYSGELGSRDYSIIAEVMGDTIMPNNITYKKIKWENAANYFNDKAPWYEYQRKDMSGNVYIYYNNNDHILYDFSKKAGESYPSHIPGKSWSVNRYTENINFGENWQIVSFQLDSLNIVTKGRRIAENIGLIEYNEIIGSVFSSNEFYNGYIFGALVNGIKYGGLLVRKDKINWSEFYPLHQGDFWVYNEGQYSPYPGHAYTKKIVRINSDTIMADGCKYFKRENRWERIDTAGNLLTWENNAPFRVLKFSLAFGDTFHLANDIYNIEKGGYGENWIINISHNSYDGTQTSNHSESYKKGIGLEYRHVDKYPYNYDNVDEKLLGAYINGVVYGDTSFSIIAVKDENIPVVAYALEQNFPNPFNPTTNITFQLPKESFVSLVVYNVLGEKVETLLNEYRGIGKHTVTFNAHNLPSGIYFYTLQTNGLTETRKMLLLK